MLPPLVTSFVISRSTTGNAVMFLIESLLFDMFVSFSYELTLTSFPKLPGAFTLTTMVMLTVSPLARLPISHE